ncbi:MAG: AraC family transcriptional regulator [Clostridia bacterium]|nr:AraC family transcriptional regulator [Clostridia bacterium]
MSYDTDRYHLKRLSGQSLGVTECGIQICHKGHATSRGSRKSYAIHFILEGKGVYTVKGRSYMLSAGEGFLITPDVPNHYRADDEEPWKYVYVSFSGADDDTLVHHAGLDEENVTFSFPLDEDMIRDLYAMHGAGKKNEAQGYDVTGYFLLCMSRLVRKNLENGRGTDAADRYVRRAILYVEDHYSERIGVDEIAAAVGLERTYLYRLFKDRLECSPREFLQSYRLERAAELLGDSTLAISEIALCVGFYDTSHFYKMFVSAYHMTPRQYREKAKEKT